MTNERLLKAVTMWEEKEMFENVLEQIYKKWKKEVQHDYILGTQIDQAKA